MSALAANHFALLQKNLGEKYLAHLPPLLKQNEPADKQAAKNMSRSFSAFALHHLTGISEADAAKAVVDDFDDYGVDAIYYHSPGDTLYLVQSKLKATEQFSQEEALAFCQGVRKLIQQDFSGFNKNVQNRQADIEYALENCKFIQLVIAHTGSGVSSHAKKAVEDLLADDSHAEERFVSPVINFDSVKVVNCLHSSQAYQRVDARISIQKCGNVTEPKITYFGLIKLTDLVALHQKHDKALYDKNIRTFLGHDTEVNVSIRKTLAEKPEHFVYLNNGVTALCDKIDPKDVKDGKKKLAVFGFSVVNGAQTIASSAKFVADNPAADIEGARVAITLIQADGDKEFGKSVTKARNHQNTVLMANFVALEDEQERLRRELAHLGVQYAYKAGAADGVPVENLIRADEAAHALALFHRDPRYVVWLKKEPATLLDTSLDRYKFLFTSNLTAYQLINAVRFARYVATKMSAEAKGTGSEKLTYKHGAFAFGWVLAKQVEIARSGAQVFDSAKISATLSGPADILRQTLWDKTKPLVLGKSPLGIYRSQAHAIPVMQEVLIQHYGLTADPAIPALKGQQDPKKAYPEKLFDYLAAKAPQISNLA
jgi:hypothetical protein